MHCEIALVLEEYTLYVNCEVSAAQFGCRSKCKDLSPKQRNCASQNTTPVNGTAFARSCPIYAVRSEPFHSASSVFMVRHKELFYLSVSPLSNSYRLQKLTFVHASFHITQSARVSSFPHE